MESSTHIPCPQSAAVNQLVPMAHVADVRRSVEFYSRLGFSIYSEHSDEHAKLAWAWVKSGTGNLMFARASGPIAPQDQAVLFYLYTNDLAGLRNHLLQSGLRDGGIFNPEGTRRQGVWDTTDPRGIVSTLSRPFYMPLGEVRVHDPDGYCLLVGQTG